MTMVTAENKQLLARCNALSTFIAQIRGALFPFLLLPPPDIEGSSNIVRPTSPPPPPPLASPYHPSSPRQGLLLEQTVISPVYHSLLQAAGKSLEIHIQRLQAITRGFMSRRMHARKMGKVRSEHIRTIANSCDGRKKTKQGRKEESVPTTDGNSHTCEGSRVWFELHERRNVINPATKAPAPWFHGILTRMVCEP